MNTGPDPDHQTLALLAHELRTPLTALIGYADAMRGQVFGPLPHPYGEHAGVILGAARHLLALVNDMTDIARAEAGIWSGERERFNPGPLAEETLILVSPRAAAAGVALGRAIGADLGDIDADRRAIGQILFNLLDNALKHTATGGKIHLAMSRRDRDLWLEVADSGGGAPASAAEGAGLGLRLVLALCAAHGGELTLDQPPSTGVTARVRLPVFPGA